MTELSVVINVINEEIPYLPRVLSSIVGLADEIILIDMSEGDPNLKTEAEKYGAKVFEHKLVPYVEPVRNYGLSKTKGNWILILDPDEELSKELKIKIKKIIENPGGDYYRIPRKNIIFGKWIQHARWWPDYNIRLMRRGHILWDEAIHSIPITKGKGMDLEPKEEYAIVHHNYASLTQYLARMDRYTSIQAMGLEKKKYRFIWTDLIRKPIGEFASRYFAGEGYKDGLHGLALSLLQAFSEMLVYLKVWEKEKFMEQGITPREIAGELGRQEGEINFWVNDMLINSTGFITSLPHRLKRKLSKRKNS